MTESLYHISRPVYSFSFGELWKNAAMADERRAGPAAYVSWGLLQGCGTSKRSGGVPDGDRRNSTGTRDEFPSQCASGSGLAVLRLPRPERLRDVKMFSHPCRCPHETYAAGPARRSGVGCDLFACVIFQ